MTTTQTFDTLASTYDVDFTDTLIGRYLRRRVHSRIDQYFKPGDSVLELGCGTGEDALYLAERGVRVTATDASEAMLALVRDKTRAHPRVRVVRFDLHNLTPPPTPLPVNGEGEKSKNTFDGAFANFGPLNVLDDWRPLAAWLAERIKPGGVIAFGVMSPYCLWEVGWHSLHGDFKTATRRLRKRASFQPGDSTPLAIHYPTIRRLTRDFAPHFKRTYIAGLGLFLPPSDVYGVIEKRPRLLRMLTWLEERFAHLGFLAPFADHYWIEFERMV
ncbi:MAG: class I SAM-dependent methyltransferase [Chloroflexi bacterium]|nr:MAG: class I SAM-dependent methyltransferase [Chloroflexota bacterium]